MHSWDSDSAKCLPEVRIMSIKCFCFFVLFNLRAFSTLPYFQNKFFIKLKTTAPCELTKRDLYKQITY